MTKYIYKLDWTHTRWDWLYLIWVNTNKIRPNTQVQTEYK